MDVLKALNTRVGNTLDRWDAANTRKKAQKNFIKAEREIKKLDPNTQMVPDVRKEPDEGVYNILVQSANAFAHVNIAQTIENHKANPKDEEQLKFWEKTLEKFKDNPTYFVSTAQIPSKTTKESFNFAKVISLLQK